MQLEQNMQLVDELENHLLDVQNLFLNIYTSAGRIGTEEQGMVQLSISQIKALLAFHKESSYSMSQLSDNAKVRLPSMSAMIERLRNQGLVDRVYDSKDRRIVLVSLTDKGIRARRSIIESRRMALCGLFNELATNAQEDLMGGLQKISAIIRRLNGEQYAETTPGGLEAFVMHAA